MMKAAYIRRGSLIASIPNEELTVANVARHDDLLNGCSLFWDAMLPPEAEEWLNELELLFKSEPGYLCVSMLTKESVESIIAKWATYIKARKHDQN